MKKKMIGFTMAILFAVALSTPPSRANHFGDEAVSSRAVADEPVLPENLAAPKAKVGPSLSDVKAISGP